MNLRCPPLENKLEIKQNVRFELKETFALFHQGEFNHTMKDSVIHTQVACPTYRSISTYELIFASSDYFVMNNVL